MGGHCLPKNETLRDSDRTGDVLKTRETCADSLWPTPTGLFCLGGGPHHRVET
jgi:hypothetical protein